MFQQQGPKSDAALEVFLLGQIDFATCLALQQRLVYEAGGRSDGQASLLICEHPGLITIGRLGSRADIRLSQRELECRQLDVRFVNRGGGSLLHAPGQLAIYPIVPLAWHGFTVAEYLARLQGGLLRTLAELGVVAQTRPGGHGIWGRTGQLAALGVAVKNWTTYFGAYINVDPALRQFRAVREPGSLPASSLAAERRGCVTMAAVRATIVGHLATALDSPRYHLYTGHPWAAQLQRKPHDALQRTP